MMRMAEKTKQSSKATGWLQLTSVVAAMVLFWTIVLPAIARRQDFQTHLKWLDDKGIDPSAMYYTELEAMDRILDKLENRGAASFPDS